MDERENMPLEEENIISDDAPIAEEENKPVVEEHNASFDEDPIIETDLSEDELQDTILADSDMNGFQRFMAKLDGKRWELVQRILGVVLGISTGLALFGQNLFGGEEEMGSYSLIIAVVIAMLVPNIIEKQGGRKIQLARVTMAITLAVVLIAYFIYAGLQSGFKFTT